MFFFKKNVEKTSDAYENRISELEKRMKNAENEILGLSVENKLLRDKVLRKIQFKRKEADQLEDEEDNEGIQDLKPKELKSPFSFHM